MPELDDEETDKLFQVGTERHDYTYNPDAWAQMEQMLDADEEDRGALWYCVAAVLALVFLVVLLFYFTNSSSTQVQGESEPSQKALSETPLPKAEDENSYGGGIGLKTDAIPGPGEEEVTLPASPKLGSAIMNKTTTGKPLSSSTTRPLRKSKEGSSPELTGKPDASDRSGRISGAKKQEGKEPTTDNPEQPAPEESSLLDNSTEGLLFREEIPEAPAGGLVSAAKVELLPRSFLPK